MEWKGSYTVEAACLMSILLPLLTAIIYLGIYLHDEAVMRNAAYELSVLGSLWTDEREAEAVLERRRQQIREEAFLGMKNLRINAERGKQKISVDIRGEFRFPGIAARFFDKSRVEVTAHSELSIWNPGGTVMRIHRIRGGQKEGEDGSEVSP